MNHFTIITEENLNDGIIETISSLSGIVVNPNRDNEYLFQWVRNQNDFILYSLRSIERSIDDYEEIDKELILKTCKDPLFYNFNYNNVDLLSEILGSLIEFLNLKDKKNILMDDGFNQVVSYPEFLDKWKEKEAYFWWQ